MISSPPAMVINALKLPGEMDSPRNRVLASPRTTLAPPGCLLDMAGRFRSLILEAHRAYIKVPRRRPRDVDVRDLDDHQCICQPVGDVRELDRSGPGEHRSRSVMTT